MFKKRIALSISLLAASFAFEANATLKESEIMFHKTSYASSSVIKRTDNVSNSDPCRATKPTRNNQAPALKCRKANVRRNTQYEANLGVGTFSRPFKCENNEIPDPACEPFDPLSPTREYN